jgi:hypothetical protein
LQNLKGILEDGQIIGGWFKVDLDFFIKRIYMPESPYSHSSRYSPVTPAHFDASSMTT